MLGSLQDAEDALQDTLLAAWQGLGGFARRASIRTWLYRIATNRCLNACRSASRRAAREWDMPGVDPPEPTRRGQRAAVVRATAIPPDAYGVLDDRRAAWPLHLPMPAAVLVMSASDRPEDVRRALRAGVLGYVGKGVNVSTLRAAIDAILGGNIYVAGALTEQPVARTSTDVQALRGLTPRERSVLVLIAEGFTHKQIGTRLGLTKATVDTYVNRVRHKFGTLNKAGLTRVAIDLALMDQHRFR